MHQPINMRWQQSCICWLRLDESDHIRDIPASVPSVQPSYKDLENITFFFLRSSLLERILQVSRGKLVFFAFNRKTKTSDRICQHLTIHLFQWAWSMEPYCICYGLHDPWIYPLIRPSYQCIYIHIYIYTYKMLAEEVVFFSLPLRWLLKHIAHVRIICLPF